MKNTILIIAGVLLLGVPAILFFFNDHQAPEEAGPSYMPDEQFSLQRAFPDPAFDLKAYSAGLKAAIQREKIASRSNEGFPGDWTIEGPGNLGARINTVAVHPTDSEIIYAGFARGGVWKTTDGGQNWAPIFDDQPFQAIGDIEIDPTAPDIVYVGTGDPNISSHPGIGDGVYKSTDGGQTWTHLGLEEQRIISQVRVNPANPNIVYAAAMGVPFEPNTQRGLYRSEDGGNSWDQILFISDQAGVIDLLMDPADPAILYASGWDRIRNNFLSIVHGPGAKVYKTTDGGDNWTQLEGGLPQNNQGRIGLAMSGTNSDVIFAEYVGTNSELFGIYKTTDGGNSWSPIPTDEFNGLSGNPLGGFGWYFGKIRVNPSNDNDILLLGVELWRTLDGGQNWFKAAPDWWTYEVHADKHDLVFGGPGASYDFLLATDGGLYANIGGTNYEDIENIPTSQFYRIAVNPHSPADYYGGMQDNGTSGGNASNINAWPRIYGGDGFQPAFHPTDPDIFFVETQNGSIAASFNGGLNFNNISGLLFDDNRRNWDMPYLISAHDPDVLYSGTYRAFRGILQPQPETVNWQIISEDLTDGVVTEPRYHTISTLDESPVVEGLLYYGATDGRLTRSNDGGENWEDISFGLPDRYVTSVKASPKHEDWVYVTHSGYKYNEFIPRVHRSTDRGENWEDISSDLPDLAINDIYILPEYGDSVLFVATDGGVYGTLDAGGSWERLGSSMPFVPVFDLEFNPWENTLAAGTFARSIMSFPLDSIMISSPDTSTTALASSYELAAQLSVFPSPAKDFLQVEFDHLEGGGLFELAILDEKGRLVKLEKGSANGYFSQQLDVSDLPLGWYIVKVKMKHTVVSERFIKVE
jgi:photosystem II stability/assembly factor-like uncharacterized protein